MANRKLQTEIERTLKKVTEGLEIFHETLEKLESATSAAQKEKVEVELKKEIKKLQRLRDLIKGWQALSEIKDKGPINEARRLIELEMERFKVLEKEMKIKAYSKEGLSQAAKLDPREQEKLSVAHWINQAVDKLGTQTDALEAELEALQIQARKSKRLDGDRQERLEKLPEMIERHKMHVRKLERLLRLLENDRVGPDGINGIKDDVEYYVEANQDPDFVPDEDLYEQFELQDETSEEGSEDEEEMFTTPVVAAPAKATVAAPKGSPSATTTEHPQDHVHGSPPSGTATGETTKDQVSPRRRSSATIDSSPPGPAVSLTGGTKSKGVALPTTTKSAAKTTTGAASTSTSAPIPTPALGSSNMPVVLPPAPVSQPTAILAPAVASPPLPKVTGPSFASAIAGSLGKSPSATPTGVSPTTSTTAVPRPQSPSAGEVARGASTHPSASAAFAPLPPAGSSAAVSAASITSPIAVPGPYEEFFAVLMKKRSESQQQQKATGSRSLRDLMTALEISWQLCPDGSETERSRTFTPKQPFSVPSYYPSAPPGILENPSIFERFELDTLFFIFYYQQRTYAQYFAARELKRQSWRFHKKYLTWFQRHEEPKTITEEYEQGTYIYFDYEGNWCQRKKSEFTFEYRYLEDEETI